MKITPEQRAKIDSLNVSGDRYCFKNQTFWMKSEAF